MRGHNLDVVPDINECATNNGNCDILVQCRNTPGSRTCDPCPSGYSGSGDTSCVGKTPLQSFHCWKRSFAFRRHRRMSGGQRRLFGSQRLPEHDRQPQVRSLCFGMGGQPGSSLHGYCGNCVIHLLSTACCLSLDVNECLTNNGGCDPRSNCTNTPGSRTCSGCPSGFSGSGLTACVGACYAVRFHCHVSPVLHSHYVPSQTSMNALPTTAVAVSRRASTQLAASRAALARMDSLAITSSAARVCASTIVSLRVSCVWMPLRDQISTSAWLTTAAAMLWCRA